MTEKKSFSSILKARLLIVSGVTNYLSLCAQRKHIYVVPDIFFSTPAYIKVPHSNNYRDESKPLCGYFLESLFYTLCAASVFESLTVDGVSLSLWSFPDLSQACLRAASRDS